MYVNLKVRTIPADVRAMQSGRESSFGPKDLQQIPARHTCSDCLHFFQSIGYPAIVSLLEDSSLPSRPCPDMLHPAKAMTNRGAATKPRRIIVSPHLKKTVIPSEVPAASAGARPRNLGNISSPASNTWLLRERNAMLLTFSLPSATSSRVVPLRCRIP